MLLIDRAWPWLWLGAALLASAACSSAPYVWVHELPREPANAHARTVIGPGDVVEIQVYGDESLSTRGRVLADGTLTMPLVGPVRVADKRPEQLENELERQLTQWVKAPEVTVIIHESVVPVAVLGEVNEAGVVDLATPATVLHALARAGGITEFADTSGIFVLRDQGKGIQRIRFTYAALVEGDPVAARFRLEAGDVLVVE